MKNETNTLVRGALLLTLAGLISKILSAGYRIPLQNLTGDLGFYIYQQVYPLLGIATVLALYGFPSAISKLTADMRAEGRQISFRNFYGPLSAILLGINGVIFIFLRMNAEFIAVWVGDKNLGSAYELVAFVFLLIPFTSLLRGVFQGYQEMKPTAYSQIGEQLVRVSIIIIAAYMIAKSGNLYNIGQAAGIAAIAGALIAWLILMIYFLKSRPKAKGKILFSWRYYIRVILLFGLVASLNHMILLIIQFADTFTLVPSLRDYGLENLDAMTMKGIFDRGQPLIQVGTVFGSSFALALIPNLTKEKLNQHTTTLYESVQNALTFSFYLSFGAMLGLILIFPETNVLLFQNDEGTNSLRILACSILLSSLAITGITILQGIGYFKRTAGFILFTFFIKWIGNQLLVPFFGINGSAVATVLSLFALCTIVLFELKRKLPKFSLLKGIQLKAFMKATLVMSLYIVALKLIMPSLIMSSRVGLLLWVIFVAMTGALFYLITLVRNQAFSKQELSVLPFASLFIRLSKEE